MDFLFYFLWQKNISNNDFIPMFVFCASFSHHYRWLLFLRGVNGFVVRMVLCVFNNGNTNIHKNKQKTAKIPTTDMQSVIFSSNTKKKKEKNGKKMEKKFNEAIEDETSPSMLILYHLSWLLMAINSVQIAFIKRCGCDYNAFRFWSDHKITQQIISIDIQWVFFISSFSRVSWHHEYVYF